LVGVLLPVRVVPLDPPLSRGTARPDAGPDLPSEEPDETCAGVGVDRDCSPPLDPLVEPPAFPLPEPPPLEAPPPRLCCARAAGEKANNSPADVKSARTLFRRSGNLRVIALLLKRKQQRDCQTRPSHFTPYLQGVSPIGPDWLSCDQSTSSRFLDTLIVRPIESEFCVSQHHDPGGPPPRPHGACG
jgi:hypothetical protein